MFPTAPDDPSEKRTPKKSETPLNAADADLTQRLAIGDVDRIALRHRWREAVESFL